MDTLLFEVTPSRIRQAANVGAKRDLSGDDAAKFLTLFHDEIEDELAQAFRRVIQRHFGGQR